MLSKVNWSEVYQEHRYSASIQIWSSYCETPAFYGCIYDGRVKPGTLNDIKTATSDAAIEKIVRDKVSDISEVSWLAEIIIYNNGVHFDYRRCYIHAETLLSFENC